MSDRIIRDELLESVRWCDLPSDSHRVVFIALVLRADDFGNLEGGNRRLFRWMHGFTQIKTDADSIKVMSDLQDGDLVRRYEVGGKEFWHLPRTNCTRTYIARIVPASPWDDPETEKKLSFQKLKNHLKQRPVEKTTVGLQQDSGSTFLGVRGKGLGEGKGEGQEKVKNIRAQGALVIPNDVDQQVWQDFTAIRKAKRSPLTSTALNGIRKQADKAGISLEAALRLCCERGWQGFKAEWMDGKAGGKAQNGISEWLNKQEKDITNG